MKQFKNYLLVISILVAVLVASAIFSGNYDNFILLPLIPFLYGVMYKYLIPSNIIWGPGFFIMNLIFFIRYIIYPYLLMRDDFKFSWFIDFRFIAPSIILMIMEMLVILFVLRYKCDKENVYNVNYNGSGLEVKKSSITFDFFVLLVVVSLLFICYVLEPNLYANKHFILKPALILEEKTEVAGVFSIISRWLEKCIILVVLTIFIKRKISFFWCLLILLIPSLFFEGHSRLSILSPTIASLFLAFKLFPQNRKIIFGFGLTMLFFSMVSLTMVKTYKVNEVNQLEISNPSSTVGAYFGGIPNVAKHLEMCERFGDDIGFETMLNDMFRNAIGVASYFSSKNNSVYYFNRTVYNQDVDRGDQIPTTIGQSVSYFGFVFFWILTYIMVTLTLWADKKYKNEQKLEFAWLYAIFAVTIGWAVPGSFQHLYMCLYYTFFPLFIIFKLYRKQ